MEKSEKIALQDQQVKFKKKKLIQFIQNKKMKKNYNQRRKSKREKTFYSSGEWNLRQRKLYVKYLTTHKVRFQNSMLRKRSKIFIKLANFIRSRTPDQCRSHHQKATLRCPDFQDLIQYQQSIINKLTKLQSNPQEAEQDISQVNGDQIQKLNRNVKQNQQAKSSHDQKSKPHQVKNNSKDIYNRQYSIQKNFNSLNHLKLEQKQKITSQSISKPYYTIQTMDSNKIHIQIDLLRIVDYQSQSISTR